MNQRLYTPLILSALVVSLGGVVASAQRTDGYREMDKAVEGATAAAEFAVKAEPAQSARRGLSKSGESVFD